MNNSTRSSATKTAPSAINRRARSDLPEPLGPTSRTPAREGAPKAAPAEPIRMHVACTLTQDAIARLEPTEAPRRSARLDPQRVQDDFPPKFVLRRVEQFAARWKCPGPSCCRTHDPVVAPCRTD